MLEAPAKESTHPYAGPSSWPPDLIDDAGRTVWGQHELEETKVENPRPMGDSTARMVHSCKSARGVARLPREHEL